MFAALNAAGAFVEGFTKLLEAYKSAGFPVPQKRDTKNLIRRRRQFCTVMRSDLEYIAKAESWNDQYFTDLEAEVETEGAYYASAWHRLIGRRSTGLRKEKSLIEAIKSSTEKSILLVGEPGAGKSVALRHLATQIAQIGIKSGSQNAVIPLYLNLRELDIPVSTPIDADLIKEFVLDNIRRGDSDTSAFVRENWREFVERGLWFFLFDSFDEIPQVLHAEKGSAAAARYSDAIRKFLDGMGECRGILASREFKGPESLPWKKFRILGLSHEKQIELIDNSFLDENQIKIARRSIVDALPTLGLTPLFLTLLCRYIKDEGRAPASDFDLLSLHIDRLAQRDARYLTRKYSLEPLQLLAGAEELARLFAEDSSLGLAPSVHQIITAQQGQRSAEEIESLLGALVDAKIGRSDVPNAAQGDRRFAFAHRRYQEALFVRHLVKNPDHIRIEQLLTDLRWREYAVTLLQTQSSSITKPIINVAAKLIANADRSAGRQMAQRPISKSIGYFLWDGDPGVYLLELLQEGLENRAGEVSPALSNAVAQFLLPRWSQGDQIDRIGVIRLGGLLPQEILRTCIESTFAQGTANAEAAAFRRVTSLQDNAFSEAVVQSVLSRLADEVLRVNDRAGQLRLEALAARLPQRLGADHVVRRCQTIRSVLKFFERILTVLFPINMLVKRKTMDSFFQRVVGFGRKKRTPAGLFMIAVIVTEVALGLILYAIRPPEQVELISFRSLFTIDHRAFVNLFSGEKERRYAMAAAVIILFVFVYFVGLFFLRDRGYPISIANVAQKLRDLGFIRSMSLQILSLIVMIGGAASILWGIGTAVRYAELPWLREEPPLIAGLFTVVLFAYSAVPVIACVLWWRRWRGFRSHAGQGGASGECAIACQAKDPSQLADWLRINHSFLRQEADIRSISALLIAKIGGGRVPKVPLIWSKKGHFDTSGANRLLQILEDRVKAARAV